MNAAETPGDPIKLPRLRRVLRLMRPFMPRSLYPLLFQVYRGYMEGFGQLLGVWERLVRRRVGFPDQYLPPPHLRYRVDNTSGAGTFLQLGARSIEEVSAALQRNGKSLDSFKSILDFGCGCGRSLIWLFDRRDTTKLYGSDIDASAIAWCQKHLDFANFEVNRPEPPLPFASGMFDLIYALSVLTHFGEQLQFDWLNELHRVASPGAALLLSVHGKTYIEQLPRSYAREVERTGFTFVNDNAYHTEEYVRREWARYFRVLDVIPVGVTGRQDLVMLEKAAR